MNKSVFHIAKMDCPSEERLIRLALNDVSCIKSLEFEISSRTLVVIHTEDLKKIISSLESLKLGASLTKTEELSEVDSSLLHNEILAKNKNETAVLRKVFIINASMFFVGFIGGWIAQSAGLISDSLDMFADAAVFALSMYAVGRQQYLKKRAARLSGFLQMGLTLLAFSEVIRRFIYGSEPVAFIMMALAFLSLLANGVSMYLLSEHKDGEVHMQASWIFLSNDVIANIGVIVAGVLVRTLHSNIPDLVVGVIISGVVFVGSLRILRAAQ